MKKIKWLPIVLILLVIAVGLCVGCQQQPATTVTKTVCELLGHDWRDADCVNPETCKVCGLTQAPALGHTWNAAACTVPATCSVCGETQGQAPGHDLLVADCVNPVRCSRCDHTEGEALGHEWNDATCDRPATCAVCALEEGEPAGHQWADATCDSPATCTVCGHTEGEKLEHNWKKATCANPRTCSLCGKTSGSALGHTWKDATCVAAKTCTTCGKTSGNALGHDFPETNNGETKTCNTCGTTVKIKCVAITFDDGPSGKITSRLLEGLEERGAKATFFICGYRIESYPKYPQKILDYGHEIGLHTYNHATLTKRDAAGIREELESMYPLLPTGYSVTLMRPPGGSYNSTVKQVCADMGLSIIMWSVDPKDWATNDVDTIVQRIVNGAFDGAIILMHDLKSSSVTAALEAIDILQAQGYEFVTVSELAAIQGRTLEDGKVYSSLKKPS